MSSKQDACRGVDTAGRLLEEIRLLASELHPRAPVSPPVTLDSVLDQDLGIDSLGRMELLARMEHAFDVALPEQQFVEADTPRDLLRVLQTAVAPGIPVAAPPGLAKPGPAEAEPAPRTARTLIEVLNWHVRMHPDRTHIVFYSDGDKNEVLTHRQLQEGAESVARGLQQRDLAPGDMVAIMLPTSRDYFLSFFGVLLAGGVPVPIYPPARRSQLEDHIRRQWIILNNCRARMLITVPEARRLTGLLKGKVDSLRGSFTVQELAIGAGTPVEQAVGPDDIAFLQYTSGSTGNPKGVILTHANLLANIRADGEAIQAGPSDVFVSWLPLYHDLGLIGAWLATLYYAAQLVIMSPLSFLARPQRWLWAIHRYQGSISAAPNFGYELCLNRIKDRDLEGLDLRSWRLTFNGAEAVSPETVRRFGERFARYGFRKEAMYPVYGLAECCLGLAFPPLNRVPLVDSIQRETFMRTGHAVTADERAGDALRFVACGRPLPGHGIRIVDAGGRDLLERREGRLQFQGPSATSGYYRNPEATRALFQGDWLDSGDLAYMADGEVYITGRTRDIVIRAGRNIYPHELEESLGDVPGIRKGRVAVFGTMDSRSGTERLVVMAETRERFPERKELLRQRISTITVDLTGLPPDVVVLAPPGTVLKTSSGKIRRTACRDLYERGLVDAPRKALWLQVARLALAGLSAQLGRMRRMLASRLYAGYVWTWYGVLGACVWLSVALLPRFSWRWSIMRAAANLLARASGTPLVVRGLEHLAPVDRPCILVANHSSYLDSYVVVAALPMAFSFLAKAELAQTLLGRVFLRRIRAELVERFERQQSIADARRAKGALALGRSLLFFPEGTFTRTPGLLAFHMGAFVLAAETGVPVVPIAIRGTRAILRPRSWFPLRGAISVTIGKPVVPDEVTVNSAGTWNTALALRDAARAHILRYCGEPDHHRTLLTKG